MCILLFESLDYTIIKGLISVNFVKHQAGQKFRIKICRLLRHLLTG